jgi:phospholipid transport system substrate-binding protein
LLCGAATLILSGAVRPSRALAATLTREAAVAFITRTGEQLVQVVNSRDSSAAKQAQLATIIERVVDVPGVARFCMGRFWDVATPAQRQEFTALFNQVIDISIGGRLGDYKGVSFTIGRAVAIDDGISVQTILNRPDNPPARVQWIVSGATGSPRIIDVVAEGTSLRLTQRSDYASFMANNGDNVQTLIDALRKQVANAT